MCAWHGRARAQGGTGGPCPTKSASATQQLQGQQNSFTREQEKALEPLEETVSLFIFLPARVFNLFPPKRSQHSNFHGCIHCHWCWKFMKHAGDLSLSLGCKKSGFGKIFKYHNSWEFWFYPVLFYVPCLWAWQNWGGKLRGYLVVKTGQINALANTQSPLTKRCPGNSQEGAG